MKGFFPNPNGADELATDEEVRSGLLGIAEGIAARVNTFANPILPARNAPTPVIQAEDSDEGVAVVTYDSGWHLDEFGNAYNPPNAPLRRGVGAAGFRFEDDDRE